MKDQRFDEMLKAALAWLKNRAPEEIAQRADVFFDGSAFRFMSLGEWISVAYPNYEITPQLPHWHHLLVLHYLNIADGSPLKGQQISFSQYEGGMVRGGDFDRRAEQIFHEFEMEDLHRKCKALGGVVKNGKADLCVELPFLPKYPVTLNFWEADEDFPASGRLTVDESAAHYLTIEDAVTVGELILQELKEKKEHGV